MFKNHVMHRMVAGAGLLSAGCGLGMMDSSMSDSDSATQLLSISPLGGTAGVAASADIVLTFNQAMMASMDRYLALHQGPVTGPTVQMNCNWSDGQKTLTCRPGQPLATATRYTVHVGGGMMNVHGQRVGLNRNGMGMGGQWATGNMMGGQSSMMGAGWSCGNGTYGMVFEFTTQ